MLRKNIDAKAEAAKMASLSLILGIAAGVAYLGLIRRAVMLLQSTTQIAGLNANFDSGLLTLASAQPGTPSTSLATVAVAALPVAIIATLALSFAARVRPAIAVFPSLLIAAAILGLLGAVALFLYVVNTARHRNDFLVALGTIVAVSILLRLQRSVRQFYRRNPALVSAIVGVVAIAYLVLTNGINISSILLSDVDIWLALIAFVLVLYSAIKMVRLGTRLRRGR
ncbi:MAG: hypothetical protein IVW57_06785 [Ktedonobacterales bacterium]|nr:hypothetical protein [Ktedonobacterales bacterium]